MLFRSADLGFGGAEYPSGPVLVKFPLVQLVPAGCFAAEGLAAPHTASLSLSDDSGAAMWETSPAIIPSFEKLLRLKQQSTLTLYATGFSLK